MLNAISSILTFPGIVVHELAHLIACRLVGVYIHDYKLFTLNDKTHVGYVAHAKSKQVYKQFIIGMAPSFVPIFIFGLFRLVPVEQYNFNEYSKLMLDWLYISILIHTLPSESDSDNVWKAATSRLTFSIFYTLYLPYVALMRLLNFLNTFFFLGTILWLLILRFSYELLTNLLTFFL
jgi:hypothetical protein